MLIGKDLTSLQDVFKAAVFIPFHTKRAHVQFFKNKTPKSIKTLKNGQKQAFKFDR